MVRVRYIYIATPRGGVCTHVHIVGSSLLLSRLSLTVQTGSISEQEFAMRIEKDLHSQHQPSLLPFLQVAVAQ